MVTIQQISDQVSACGALITSIGTSMAGLQALLAQAGTVIPATVQTQIDALGAQVDAQKAALQSTLDAIPKV